MVRTIFLSFLTGFTLACSALALALALALVLPQTAWSKDFSSWSRYSQAELVTETTAFTPGAVGVFGFKIKLAPGWHTYWVNPGDSGTPVHFKFKTSRGLKVQNVLFPLPEREQSGPLISFAYTNEVVIPVEAQIDSKVRVGETVRLEVDAEWLVCEDVCIPAIQTVVREVPVQNLVDVRPSADFSSLQKARNAVPEQASENLAFAAEKDGLKLALPARYQGEQYVDFFPFKSSGASNAKPEWREGNLYLSKANVSAEDPRRLGVLVVRSSVNDQIRAVQFGDSGWKFEEQQEALANPLWWMLLSAFLGGLILNLMPCVFPILSMKLLSLLKLAEAHPREVRAQNLSYVVGVLFSFVAIALMLSILRSAGHLIGWGFQLQSPVFLTFLTWLFFVLALNLLGVYEIDLLNAGLGDRLTRVGGLWGSFFTGVLAVIVASPCTAPFMGVALGFGLSQSSMLLVAVFLCLGLGLAFPYLLFVLFPSLAQHLPRPGKWMNVVKQIMAFPLLVTAMWMLWLLGQAAGPLGVAAVLAGCLALGIAFSIPPRWRILVNSLTAAVLVTASAGIYSLERVEVRTPDSEHELWQAYSEARFSSLKGKNIFINMTADWCLTCKVNEHLVLDDIEVRSLLQKKNVIWLKGDWTRRNEEITSFLNKYQRVGVPFYVLFSASNVAGTTLPEVLTKSTFIEFINKEFP